MDENLSLYENLKALIEIEQDSGTSSLFSEFALDLSRRIEQADEDIKRLVRTGAHHDFIDASYVEFFHSIVGW